MNHQTSTVIALDEICQPRFSLDYVLKSKYVRVTISTSLEVELEGPFKDISVRTTGVSTF